MSRLILSFFRLMSNGVLLIFTLRRWLFLLIAWKVGTMPQSRRFSAPLLPCLLLIPFRDEAANLHRLLPMIGRLDYASEYLTVVLIDDGSQDGSGRFCQQFITQHRNWHLLTLPRTLGKAAALNEALNRFPKGEFVAVFDADERPSPHALIHLLAAFSEGYADEEGQLCGSSSVRLGKSCQTAAPPIGAVNGRRVICNPLATPIASYATLENIVHQLITNRAKDALGLAPALLGSNCIYQRQALTAVQNFNPNTFLEDSDFTVRLARAGWQTRFVSDAVSYHAAPETVSAYWQQHTRWHTGFQQVAQEQIGALLTQAHLPWPLRLELFLFSLGYLDRIALLGAIISWWQHPSRCASLNINLSLFTPFIQIIYALRLYSRSEPQQTTLLQRRLVYLPLFYTLDIFAALTSTIQKLCGHPIRWETRSG